MVRLFYCRYLFIVSIYHDDGFRHDGSVSSVYRWDFLYEVRHSKFAHPSVAYISWWNITYYEAYPAHNSMDVQKPN